MRSRTAAFVVWRFAETATSDPRMYATPLLLNAAYAADLVFYIPVNSVRKNSNDPFEGITYFA